MSTSIPWLDPDDPRHVACPSCGADPGGSCRDIASGELLLETVHASRKRRFAEEVEDR